MRIKFEIRLTVINRIDFNANSILEMPAKFNQGNYFFVVTLFFFCVVLEMIIFLNMFLTELNATKTSKLIGKKPDSNYKTSLVYFMEKKTNYFLCGGALLTNTHVITIALFFEDYLMKEIPLANLLVGIGLDNFNPKCKAYHHSVIQLSENGADEPRHSRRIVIATVSTSIKNLIDVVKGWVSTNYNGISSDFS